jgi:hypothetical protein
LFEEAELRFKRRWMDDAKLQSKKTDIFHSFYFKAYRMKSACPSYMRPVPITLVMNRT